MIALLLAGFLVMHPGGEADPSAYRTSGDAAFYRIAYPEAVSAYEAALQVKPDDPDLLWRIARVYVCMAEVAELPAREPLLKTAEKYARQCITLNANLAEGHTWLAGALGFEALEAGMHDQVRISRELVTEVQRALAINPNDDVALGIKGSFYRAVGNVGWVKRQLAGLLLGSIPEGGYEDSEAALLRAIQLAPDVMRHQYELGVLYLDMEREEEGYRILRQALLLPVKIASDRPRLEKIRELLAGGNSAIAH